MNSKKILKTLLSIIGIILLSFIILLGILIYKGAGITIGRCLIANNDSYMLIDDNSPIVMSTNHTNIFRNLTTGDKILVIHSVVNESYPGGTGAYFCMKLADGDISDIPDQVIETLTEMGWLEQNVNDDSYDNAILNVAEPIHFQSGEVQIVISIPSNWEYSFQTNANSNEAQGISFWPKGTANGNISLTYYPEHFGVCGTGLHEKDIMIGDYEARLGKYEDLEHWSFIHFKEPYDKYVVLNNSTDEWLDKYEEELQLILDSVEFPYLILE